MQCQVHVSVSPLLSNYKHYYFTLKQPVTTSQPKKGWYYFGSTSP